MSLASYLAAPPRGTTLSERQVSGASSVCQGCLDSRRTVAPRPLEERIERCGSNFTPARWLRARAARRAPRLSRCALCEVRGIDGRGRQRGRLQKLRPREVEELEHRVGVRVAGGERREVDAGLDN